MGISEVVIFEFRYTSQVTLKLCPGKPPLTFATDSFLILLAAAVASDSAYPKCTDLEVWPRVI